MDQSPNKISLQISQFCWNYIKRCNLYAMADCLLKCPEILCGTDFWSVSKA